jgi:hypothetical protein
MLLKVGDLTVSKRVKLDSYQKILPPRLSKGLKFSFKATEPKADFNGA